MGGLKVERQRYRRWGGDQEARTLAEVPRPHLSCCRLGGGGEVVLHPAGGARGGWRRDGGWELNFMKAKVFHHPNHNLVCFWDLKTVA